MRFFWQRKAKPQAESPSLPVLTDRMPAEPVLPDWLSNWAVVSGSHVMWDHTSYHWRIYFWSDGGWVFNYCGVDWTVQMWLDRVSDGGAAVSGAYPWNSYRG